MRADLNPGVTGLHGAMGKWVYRQVDGQTIVSRKPGKSPRKASEAQAQQRKLLAGANRYAKRILADPLRRRAYEELARRLGRRYDRLPVSDFLNPPVVEEIDVSDYRGQPGDVINIYAVDDIEVVALTVVIRTALGEVVESGPASSDHGAWRYTATRPVAAGTAVVVTATAKDRPEHEGAMSITHIVAAALAK